MTIALPTNPDGEQYEDLVISTLLVLGYFVETNMTLSQEGKEILELDVVATPLGGSEDDRVLHEVKKGGFSFTNVFKLYGQRLYLGINAGQLVSLKGANEDHLPIYRSKGKEVNISICHFPLDAEKATCLAEEKNSLALPIKEKIVPSVWYTHIARRVALTSLRTAYKQNKGIAEYANARAYQFSSKASFFQKTALARAETLYKAYLDNPKLSGRLVSHISTQHSVTEPSVWTQARDTHEHLDVQSLMDLESLVRFSILKNAFDDYVSRGDAPPPSETVSLGDISFDVPRHNLPQSYYAGDALKNGHIFSSHSQLDRI